MNIHIYIFIALDMIGTNVVHTLVVVHFGNGEDAIFPKGGSM